MKAENTRASQAGTGGTQQPPNVGMPMQGETSTGTSKRPRPEGRTLTKRVRPNKIPGTYKEALTNIVFYVVCVVSKESR
jgi:hypothetical protein